MSRNQMQVFCFEDAAVRTIERNGVPWFVAKDVATVLGYSNSRDAIAKHCKAPDTVANRDGIPGNPNIVIIPERDVYRLIMRSKLPAAERFEEWVVAEVLPAIRKTGQYSARDKRRPEIEATNTFRSLHGVARLMGLGRNNAALAANAATINLIGTDLMGLMGVKLSPDEEDKGGISNPILVEGLVQLLGTDGMTIKATFKDVLGKLAAIVGPGRADDLPTPHTFRRCLNQERKRLDREGITFVFGRHTNRGHTIRLSRRPQETEINNAAYI